MRYQGGKSREKRVINDVMRRIEAAYKDNKPRGPKQPARIALRLEVCCGGGAVTEVWKPELAIDLDHRLIEMYKAGQQGWRPFGNRWLQYADYERWQDVPIEDMLTDEEYSAIKTRARNQHMPDLEAVFIGFFVSFGSRYMSGRSRANQSPNAKSARAKYVEVSTTRLFDIFMKSIPDVKFECHNYCQWDMPQESLVYCDKPYHDATGYPAGDSRACDWWGKLTRDSEHSIIVVSDAYKPPGWTPVHTFSNRVGINNRTAYKDKLKAQGVPEKRREEYLLVADHHHAFVMEQLKGTNYKK